MKAREYAEDYKANPSLQKLGEIVSKIFLEIEGIAKIRHVKNDEAILSILTEQDQKWRTFVQLVGDSNINPAGFENFIKKRLPEAFDKWQAWKTDRRRR